MVEVMDHYRADADAPLAPGVYRVVGADEDSVALLRVAEDGRRVNTGVVVALDREDLATLAPADDPDGGLGRLRQVPSDVATRPLPWVLGVGLVALGGYRAARGDAGGYVLAAGGLAVLWLLLR